MSGLPLQKQTAIKQPMVRYHNVEKCFGENRVLHQISLDIAPNEKVAVIGPSGSGKTTLIRMLMTLEKPTSGIIYVDGEPLWHKRSGERLAPADERHLHRVRGKIGMVFQQFNLFPHMTVLRNCIEAPIHVLGTPKKEAVESAKYMLAKVGLADKINCYPSQLSGGQQQRVAIARALVMRPKVMLFDEVTSALDPELVGEVLEVIREIAGQGDMTMILVTHEMDFARDIADRVVFIDGGQIVEQGPPLKLFENPQSSRLHTFLGRFRSAARPAAGKKTAALGFGRLQTV